MGISRIFDLSRRSLTTYQRALDVTAHNITNASNTKYSRQVINLQTEKPDVYGGFSWGTGVSIASINRVRDSLTDTQIRSNNQKFSNNNTRGMLLGQVEGLFSEPSELGISNLTTQFFNSWQELSVTPDSMPLRYNVLRSAEKLSTKVRSAYEGLDIVQSDILSDVKTKVESLNTLVKEVQSLNSQIFEYTATGLTPNDILDRRDNALDELSKLANITVSYDDKNSAIVSIGGTFATDRSTYVEFQAVEKNGKLAIVPKNGELNATLNGGELSALTRTYNEDIPNYKNQLDSFISSLADSVNNLHKTGYSINNPPQTNVNFFESSTDGYLKINEDILLDPKKLSISADGTSGNAAIAVKIAELSGAKILNGITLGESYSSLISEIGNNKLSSDEMAESDSLILEQLETQKQSYSGVSVDEEMTNVIKYQRSYDASAKLIKVADEMLQTIIGMV